MDQKRIEIRSVIGTAIGITDINDADYFDCAHFLSENKWFGVKPQMESGKYYVSTDEADFLSAKVSHFMSIKDLPQEKKKELLDEEFSRKWPTAYSAFRDFEENAEISDDSAYGVESFLNTFLTKDLDRLMDDDVKVLVRRSFENDYKYIGDGMTFYLAYARSRKIRVNNGNGTIKINKYHTHYNTDFIMQHRVDTTTQKSAYDEEEYLQLIYFLLNPEYIEDREMYKQAANSKNYADTWLYLSLHFITAMRDTNIVLLYHPRLPYPPDEVLERVRTNAYSPEDAKNVSCALMEWMYYLQQKPHKTADTSNVPRVPFFIPVSLEEHFGILFSVCEAHHQLSGLTERDPLIRKIKTYDQINSYMGEEIGSLFLE